MEAVAQRVDLSGAIKSMPGCRRTSWRVVASRSCCCRRVCVSGCPRAMFVEFEEFAQENVLDALKLDRVDFGFGAELQVRLIANTGLQGGVPLPARGRCCRRET